MNTKKLCSSAVILLLIGLSANALAQTEPFSVTEAPFGSPVMDGDISDWMAMRNDKNVLNFSFTHGQRENAAVGEPFEVNIQYAWDETNFYFLAEEISDDDPSTGLNDLDWCQECEGSVPGAAPWSTDSVGFYDQGITWPAGGMPSEDLAPLSTAIQEMGPFTQFWVGMPTADDIIIDGEKQNYHLTRILSPGGGEGGARLIGDRSSNENFVPMIPDLPELTTVQSAHGIVDDGSNGGRGRRFTEAFMRWDQIRYPDPEKHPDLADTDYGAAIVDRLDALNFPEDTSLEVDQMVGHYIEDIGEGYEFRLDPLLVDGLEEPVNGEFPFGGQTHPSGTLHPNKDLVMEWDQISVVRLVAASAAPTCESIAASRVAGDADGDGEVAFLDFLALANNFGQNAGYDGGDFDCDGEVAFLDFLALANNFGATAAASTAASVPEPSGLFLCGLAGLCGGVILRRRRRH